MRQPRSRAGPAGDEWDEGEGEEQPPAAGDSLFRDLDYDLDADEEEDYMQADNDEMYAAGAGAEGDQHGRKKRQKSAVSCSGFGRHIDFELDTAAPVTLLVGPAAKLRDSACPANSQA